MDQEKGAGNKYPAERRRFARIPVNLQIKFKSIAHFEQGLDASIKNLSLGGVFISTKQVKPVGTKVEIEIPGNKGRVLKINGIVRSAVHSGDELVGMGIQFENLSELGKKYIEYVINKHKK